jgi:hypothetical protein
MSQKKNRDKTRAKAIKNKNSEERKKSFQGIDLSRSTDSWSPAIKAIKAMRYMWSAIDSGPLML